MSIPTELESLQQILETVTVTAGLAPIRKVYVGIANPPPTTEDCPCIVVFIKDPMPIGAMTFGNEQRDTTYTCQFIYTPVGQGEFTEVYFKTVQYVEPVLDVLWAHIQLNSLDGVNWSLPNQVAMPQELPERWGGQSYFGMEFKVNVTASRSITIGS